jgi:hypothetical protein
MGKVSSKNNRRHTAGKVRLPKKRHPTKGRVADAFVAQRWDHGKTVAQNMGRMGLVADLNSEVRLASSKPLRLNATSALEFLSIVDGVAPAPASGTLHVVSDKQTKDFMKADETEYLKVRCGVRVTRSIPPLSPHHPPTRARPHARAHNHRRR